MASEITVATTQDSDRWMGIVQQLMTRPDFSIDQLERILALRSKELDDQAREAGEIAYAACQAKVNRVSRDKSDRKSVV